MTAIGGVVGAAADLPRLCSSILAAQRPYGAQSTSIEIGPAAALGTSADGSVAGDGRWLVVADSRLDNAGEVARAVGLGTASDAQLLLAAWTKWGEDALQRILGDFAFAVYDRASRKLSLARDPTGQRPLFYKSTNGATAFASMPSGLADIFARSGPNLGLLARTHADLPHRDEQSFFEGIQRVLPGEVVHVDGHSTVRRLYWQPCIEPQPNDSGEDYVEPYRALLDTAVVARMAGRSNPFGCHLSSGFDSSAVTGTAARLLHDPNELIAFTAAPLPGSDGQLPRHRFADESRLATETARMHGLRHVIVRETAPLFDVIERQTERMQAPQLSPFNLAWGTEIRRRASELGIDTILTAEIGNLTLNASGLRTLSRLVASGDWGRWWREASLAVRRSDMRWRGVILNSFGPWLPRAAWTGLRRAFLGIPDSGEICFIRPDWLRQFEGGAGPVRPGGDPYGDRLDVIRLNDLGLYRKAAEADGIEERDPMSDRRIIEFSLRLPHDQLFRDGQPRPLARAALSDRVPPSVLNLKRRGMQGTDWHLRIDQQKARDVLEGIAPNPLVQELLDLPKLRRAIDDWPTGDWNHYRVFLKYRDRLTGALATGIFLTRFSAPGPARSAPRPRRDRPAPRPPGRRR